VRPRRPPENWNFLVDSTTGAPVGIQNWNANGSDALWPPSGTVVYASQYASIQAAHDSLPSTGGMIVLAPNTTYVQQTETVISKNNVTVWAPGWGTVLKRDASLTGATAVIRATGTNCKLYGFTVDGNGGVVNPSGIQTDVGIDGAGCVAEWLQVINGTGTIQLRLNATGARASYCTVTGMASATVQTYGIWAINGVKVTVDHCTVTATGIDGIGVNGPGTQVTDNYVSGCHCYTGGGGGQIVTYAYTGADSAVLVSGNVVGAGGSTQAGGIELEGDNVRCVNNTVSGTGGEGISLTNGVGICVQDNMIRNVGTSGSNTDGIYVTAGVTDFVIEGNRVIDDRTPADMRFGCVVNSGTSDRYTITGNLFLPSGTQVALGDNGTGLNKVVRGNAGVDTVTPTIASAATITLPVNPTFALTGSVGVNDIGATNLAYGRSWTALPNGAVIFTAGNNIQNTVTTVANVPLSITCDASGHLWLK
jgi:hypothetical protein